MKILKKISLAYVLQILAVVLLFGFAISSPAIKKRESVTEGIMPLKLNNQSPAKSDEDSVFTGKINGLWNVNTAKSR
jgi:uncharacterized protein (UPF0333 family)